MFFEIVLVPMYFLIGGWGHGRRVYAAVKFFLYTMFGSAMMLVGILTLVFLTSSATGNPITFDLVELANTQALAVNTARWVFLAFALAFAVKVPMFPLHTWLPDAHTEAPTAGSVILAGVLLKMGGYGIIRMCVTIMPGVADDYAIWFAGAVSVPIYETSAAEQIGWILSDSAACAVVAASSGNSWIATTACSALTTGPTVISACNAIGASAGAGMLPLAISALISSSRWRRAIRKSCPCRPFTGFWREMCRKWAPR